MVVRGVQVLKILLVFIFAENLSIAQETLDIHAPQQLIIRGERQDRSEWPATYIFRRFNGVGVCTATIVGPYVILTAAHCLPAGGVGGRVVLDNGDIHSVDCSIHPEYGAGNISADWALCYSETDVGFRVGKFEAIRASGTYMRAVQGKLVGREVTLLGFGCREEQGNDRNFGTLYGGTSTIRALWGGKNHYVRTEGGSALCFGDSGGAAYYFDSASGRRAIIGVNSRGDVSRTSLLASTWDPAFEKWAIEWADSWTARSGKAVKICGIYSGVDTEAGSCRLQPDM